MEHIFLIYFYIKNQKFQIQIRKEEEENLKENYKEKNNR